MALEEEVQALRERFGELQSQLAHAFLHRADKLERLRIEVAVNTALLRLICEDTYLLKIDANELSITHRLAMYLQDSLPDWDVDCEYNRDLEGPKRVCGPTGRDIIIPDIIVHHRGHHGTTSNLLAIEVKKSGSQSEDDAAAREKLRKLRKQHEYKYKHTLFLKLKTGKDGVGVELLEWTK